MWRLFALTVSLLGLAVLMLAVVGMGPTVGLQRDYAEAARPEQSGEYSASSPNELLTPTAVYTYYFPAIYHNYTVPTWQSLGLRGISVSSIAVDPDGVLYAGTGDQGIYRSTDFGENWYPINRGLGDDATVSEVEVDPHNSQTVYACALTNQPWFFHSYDGGNSWTSASAFTFPLVVLEAHPAVPGRLFLGEAPFEWAGGGRVYKSEDGGLHWTQVITERVIAYTIVASALDPSLVYVGAYLGLYRSEDGGDTWMRLTNGLPDGPIHAMALHPTEPLTAYAGTEAGIFKTTDGGDSWTAWGVDSPSWPMDHLLIEGYAPEIQYADFFYATGVYVSFNEGQHWQPMNAGLGSPAVRDLVLDQTSAHLYAATADGVWALRLDEESEP